MKNLKVLFLLGILASTLISCSKQTTQSAQDELALIQKEMATDDAIIPVQGKD